LKRGSLPCGCDSNTNNTKLFLAVFSVIDATGRRRAASQKYGPEFQQRVWAEGDFASNCAVISRYNFILGSQHNRDLVKYQYY